MKCERKKIPAQIGSMSLVGTGFNNEFPMSFGNYFMFLIDDRDKYNSIPDWLENCEVRCVNMWAENLGEAKKRFLDDGMVECDIYSEWKEDQTHLKKWAVVVDERIPKNWLLDYPCFTGYFSMPVETLHKCEHHYGWSHEQLIYYYDIDLWAELTGYNLIRKNDDVVLISKKVEPQSRKLKDNWSIHETNNN